MKKQVLVTVDRGRDPRRDARGGRATPAGAKQARRREAGRSPTTGYRVAELYFERRGSPLDRRQHLQGQGRQRPARHGGRVRRHRPRARTASCTSTRSSCPGGEQVAAARPRQAAGAIDELIKPGQEILVQVVKDPLKTKGARLSMQLSIAGRYLVYAPQGEGVGVSRRLDGQGARPPAQAGPEARPRAAAARSSAPPPRARRKADFERELEYLYKLNEVLRAARRGGDGARRWSSRRPTSRSASLRDVFSERVRAARSSTTAKQHHRVTSFFQRTAPELVDRVELYEEREPLFEA